MKKIPILILCLLFSLILTGCFESEESKARKKDKETTKIYDAPGTINRNF